MKPSRTAVAFASGVVGVAVGLTASNLPAIGNMPKDVAHLADGYFRPERLLPTGELIVAATPGFIVASEDDQKTRLANFASRFRSVRPDQLFARVIVVDRTGLTIADCLASPKWVKATIAFKLEV